MMVDGQLASHDFSLPSTITQKFNDEIQVLSDQDGVLFLPTFPKSAPVHRRPLLTNTFDYIYCGIINALGLSSTECPLGIQCVASRGHN